MVSKFDKFCDFCGCLVEGKKGIIKDFVTRSFGTEKSPVRKRICKDCDARNKEIYKS